MKVVTSTRMRIVRAIETYDVVILIFDPDAAEEASLAGIFLGCYIEDDAANLAEKLAAHKSEIVESALKIFVHDHHLSKTQRHELQRINTAQLAEHSLAQISGGRRIE